MSMTPYTFDLEPGQTKHQTFGEANFIFVDFADRELEVSINGSWQTLRKGTKFKSRTGMFDQFEIRNPDPNRPCRVIMFIGTDEIENLIVEGEIGIVPLLRNADGTTKPDTRYDILIDLVPATLEGDTFTEGQTLATAIPGNDYESATISCWGPGDVIAQMHVKTGSHALGEYDQKLNLLNLYQIKNNGWGGSPVAMGWTVDSGYFYIPGDTSNLVYKIEPGTTTNAPVLKDLGKSAHSLCVDIESNLIYVIFNDKEVREYTGDFVETGRTWVPPIAGVDQYGLYFDRARGQFVAATSNALYYLDRNFELIEQITPDPFNGNFNSVQAVILDNVVFHPRGWRVKPATMDKRVLYDFTSKPEVRSIRPGCALAEAKRKARTSIQPTGLTFEYAGNYLKASGEVIRGLLEYYFQRTVADDYLDHVYGLDLSLNDNGTRFKPIVTGNETFARAGVQDAFTFLIPNRATIKIDNELALGSALALKGV